MNLDNVHQHHGKLTFTMDNVDLPYVNGIRRTILSDINVIGIKGFPHNKCDIVFIQNDTNLNNEMLKQRIISIPVHVLNPDNQLYTKIKIILNVENKTETVIPITSEHINIVDIASGNSINREIIQKIFPPNSITNDYVLISYLKPLPDSVSKLHFEATFSVVNPSINSVYNCVSTISFSNTIDVEKQEYAWNEFQKQIPPDSCDMETEKQNWRLLKGQHYYKENSYDFVIKTIGFIKNKQILIKACNIITEKLTLISQGITINPNKKNNIPNSFNIILENEDYTIGNIMKKVMYDMYFPQTISYVGFFKEHPHDSYSTLRVGFNSPVDNEMVMDNVKNVCIQAISVLSSLEDLFESSI